MKSVLHSLVALIALAAAAPHAAQASERASTSQLPPALAAMGVGQQNVLSRTEAQEVRGEGLLLLSSVKANVGVAAVVKAPIVGKVAAAANVNVKVGVAGSLLGGKHY